MSAPSRRRSLPSLKQPDSSIWVGPPSRWANPFPIGAATLGYYGPVMGAGAGFYDPADERSADIALPHPFNCLTAHQAVALYRADLEDLLAQVDDPELEGLRDALAALRGYDLACSCEWDAPCHADVLLELANR